jgi:hypothetical protein
MPVNDRNDPGVPEALPRTLVRLVEAVGAERLDGLWIFPPLIKGRREWGLVVASCFAGEGTLDIAEQGEAPPDRFPRVVDGVVRRSGTELGDPREVLINGDADAVQELMDEFDPALLETVES